jgi:glycosyltransferase involved in cell wall biosynthesis
LPRIVIDISSLAHWLGPPAGISRCQSIYANFALRNFPEAVFTIYDPRRRQFRMLSQQWASAVLEGTARTDMTMMPDASGVRRRTIDYVPAALHQPFWWVTQLRRKSLAQLEQWRLGAASSRRRSLIQRAQAPLITRKYRRGYYAADGSRVDWPAFEFMAGPALMLEPSDTTIAMQYDWMDTNIDVVARMRQAAGSRHVVLCHDIIPLQSPEWFSPVDVAIFKAYYDRAFAVADRVIFTSQRTAVDAAAYCRSIGVGIADHRVVPMGSNAVAAAPSDAALPRGLDAGRFVLFVSTIEPRKNHQFLIDGWRRLVADGTVASSGFKLVLVGRKGWMMEGFFDQLRSDPGLRSSVIHLSDIGDAVLSRLYRDAAFCVYPPKFEGFGLPPVEALASGQALIVSNAGPMPEVVGDFALCLDPNDLDAWTGKLREWMNGSPERERFAARARAEYKPVTWEDSARAFFEAALSRS